MAKELIFAADGALHFGDHSLPEKAKSDGFAFDGNLYKVKTFRELTRLERDGMFVYESEPGTSVADFVQKKDGVAFTVAGNEDVMITVGLREDTEYEVSENGKSIGRMKTNLGGKLSFSVAFENASEVKIIITE